MRRLLGLILEGAARVRAVDGVFFTDHTGYFHDYGLIINLDDWKRYDDTGASLCRWTDSSDDISARINSSSPPSVSYLLRWCSLQFKFFL